MGEALKTILIIEDDHDTRVSMRQELEAAGYYVVSVANGRHGLELLKRMSPPGLILVDLVMPIMDGEEFVRVLGRDPVLSRVPVVIVTAFPNRAKSVVATARVPKPVTLNRLLEVAARYCSA